MTTGKNIVLTLLLLPTLALCSQKVYLMHGYGSSTLFMKKIENHLKKNRFPTINYRYKSMRDDLDTIGLKLYKRIKADTVDTVCFVTHSMGALVVRSMLNYSTPDSTFPVIFRIVMIAPPNHGAEIANFFSSPWLSVLLGPNVAHMRTDSGSYANRLPVPKRSEVGIIIGVRQKPTGYNPLIKGDNDGYLTPEKAKLGVEKDIAVLKEEHTILTMTKKVRQLVLSFLTVGSFKK